MGFSYGIVMVSFRGGCLGWFLSKFSLHCLVSTRVIIVEVVWVCWIANVALTFRFCVRRSLCLFFLFVYCYLVGRSNNKGWLCNLQLCSVPNLQLGWKMFWCKLYVVVFLRSNMLKPFQRHFENARQIWLIQIKLVEHMQWNRFIDMFDLSLSNLWTACKNVALDAIIR